jgi:hypothetical protein
MEQKIKLKWTEGREEKNGAGVNVAKRISDILVRKSNL